MVFCSFIIFLRFHLFIFREGGARETERERKSLWERSMDQLALAHPNRAPSPPPGLAPSAGIKLATFWFAGPTEPHQSGPMFSVLDDRTQLYSEDIRPAYKLSRLPCGMGEPARHHQMAHWWEEIRKCSKGTSKAGGHSVTLRPFLLTTLLDRGCVKDDGRGSSPVWTMRESQRELQVPCSRPGESLNQRQQLLRPGAHF